MTRHQPGALCAVGLCLLLCACGNAAPGKSAASAGAAASIPVVGAENFYGDLLRQVCGGHCAVTAILSDPNADPHEYESDARDAAAVARARLVVENGVGYDSFIDHLLAASPNADRTVIDVQTLMGVQDGANPHLWYDPATMPKVANAVAAALARIDPADAAAFGAGADAFIASLQPVTDEIAAVRKAHPNAPVAFTEPVFGYMGQALGLRVLTPEAFQKAVEDGEDPSVAAMAAEQDLLTGRKVKVLIYNLQTVTPVTTQIQNLARSHDVPVVGVSETEPPNTAYATWMLDQLKKLQAALDQGASGGH